MCVCVCVKVAQSCPTFRDPMDRSLPGSSVYVILRARMLEWVAIIFSRGYNRVERRSPESPALRAGTLQSEPPGKPRPLPLPANPSPLQALPFFKPHLNASCFQVSVVGIYPFLLVTVLFDSFSPLVHIKGFLAHCESGSTLSFSR